MRSSRMYLLLVLITIALGGFVAFSLTLGEDRGPNRANPTDPPPEKIDTAPTTSASYALVPPGKSSGSDSGDPQSSDAMRLREAQSEVERGAQWLAGMSQVNGRFLHGVLPALNRALEGDDYIHQLEAALALARAARFLNDKSHAAIATQAVLRFLDDTVVDPGDGQFRHSGPGVDADPLACAGLLVEAVHELPLPQADILDKAEQLCRFIASRQEKDGSFRCICNEPNSAKTSAGAQGCVPGQALCGLMTSQRHRPAPWKTDVVRKAFGYYYPWWKANKSAELAASQTPAYADAFLLTKSQEFADAVFEMNDWLCSMQYSQLDPRHQEWWGGFKAIPDDVAACVPHVHGSNYARSLASACRVAREVGDAQRFYKQYKPALELWRTYIARLQYVEANTQHFDPTYRRRHLLGGFHASTEDGTLRIDYTGEAVGAPNQYLTCVLRNA